MPTATEIDELKKSKKEIEAGIEEAKRLAEEKGDVEKIYDLDNYDDDDEDEEEEKGRKCIKETKSQ